MKNPILANLRFLAKSIAVFLCFSMISTCKAEPNQTGHSSPEDKPEGTTKTENVDPFQKTAIRLVSGGEIPLEKLDKELKKRKWSEIRPILLASIKKRSQEPDWTREAQTKAGSNYFRVKLYFAKRLRASSLDELKRTIQKALEEEQASKRE